MGIFRLKKMCLILFMLLLCGCDVSYELEIKNNEIYETSQLLVSKVNSNKTEKNGLSLEEEINYGYESLHDVKNGQEETKTRNFLLTKINDKNNIGLNYSNRYNYKNFETSPIIKQCYEDVNIDVEDDKLFINTSDYFKCFDYYNYINNIKVSLKTNYKVMKHNADSHKDNVYSWYINKNNFTNKNINIEIDTKYDILKENKKNDKIIKNVLCGLILLIFVLIIVVSIKFKNSNKK